jgi:hypothetical protein
MHSQLHLDSTQIFIAPAWLAATRLRCLDALSTIILVAAYANAVQPGGLALVDFSSAQQGREHRIFGAQVYYGTCMDT